MRLILSRGNMRRNASATERFLPSVLLSLRNPGAAALFVLPGTKGHKYVKSEMAAHEINSQGRLDA